LQGKKTPLATVRETTVSARDRPQSTVRQNAPEADPHPDRRSTWKGGDHD
jgi:hypothetical protein